MVGRQQEMMYDGTLVHVIDAEVVGVKALSTMWCLLVVVELVWTWGMQQTVLEAGNGVAMALAWQKVELAWTWHLLQQTVLEAGKGVAMVMVWQDVEWLAWGTLELKQDIAWRLMR